MTTYNLQAMYMTTTVECILIMCTAYENIWKS